VCESESSQAEKFLRHVQTTMIVKRNLEGLEKYLVLKNGNSNEDDGPLGGVKI